MFSLNLIKKKGLLSAFYNRYKSLHLQMPKVQYRSNCKPSTFAYPPALEIPKEKEKEKVSGGAYLALLS